MSFPEIELGWSRTTFLPTSTPQSARILSRPLPLPVVIILKLKRASMRPPFLRYWSILLNSISGSASMGAARLLALAGDQRLNIQVRQLGLGNDFETVITLENDQVLVRPQSVFAFHQAGPAWLSLVIHRVQLDAVVAKTILLEQGPDRI